MSAWIVEKGHIDVIVQALIVERLATMDDADAIGEELWHENHLSVNYRYDEATATPEYHFTGIEAPLEDAVVYKQLACYEYQSCEHDGWEASRSRALVVQLADVLVARHDGDKDFADRWVKANYSADHPGCNTYGSIKWGVSSIQEARAIGRDAVTSDA